MFIGQFDDCLGDPLTVETNQNPPIYYTHQSLLCLKTIKHNFEGMHRHETEKEKPFYLIQLTVPPVSSSKFDLLTKRLPR